MNINQHTYVYIFSVHMLCQKKYKLLFLKILNLVLKLKYWQSFLLNIREYLNMSISMQQIFPFFSFVKKNSALTSKMRAEHIVSGHFTSACSKKVDSNFISEQEIVIIGFNASSTSETFVLGRGKKPFHVKLGNAL